MRNSSKNDSCRKTQPAPVPLALKANLFTNAPSNFDLSQAELGSRKTETNYATSRFSVEIGKEMDYQYLRYVYPGVGNVYKNLETL